MEEIEGRLKNAHEEDTTLNFQPRKWFVFKIKRYLKL